MVALNSSLGEFPPFPAKKKDSDFISLLKPE
jgi:hypothetical protein